MAEYANKFDRIRQQIEEKYGDKVKVTVNEYLPALPRFYESDQILNVLKLFSKLKIGQNVKLHFESGNMSTRCSTSLRYHIHKQKISGVRIFLRLHDVYIVREAPQNIMAGMIKKQQSNGELDIPLKRLYHRKYEDGLSEEFIKILRLRDEEGKSFSDICDDMDLTQKQARSLYHNAKHYQELYNKTEEV